jgi:hypothetical protein
MYSTTYRLLLVPLLTLLLAACGGAPMTAPAPALDRPAAQAAPTALAAAPEAALEPPRPLATPAPYPTAPARAADEATAGEIAPIAEAPRAQQQVAAPIRAGEVDDNTDFAAYLDYLAGYQGPGVLPLDVRERQVITIVNEQQQPVVDARVRLFDGSRRLFDGRTYAGGQTIFFPRAHDLSNNVSELRVIVEKGNSTTEGILRRGEEQATFVLSGAGAAQPLRVDILFLLDATGSMGDEIGRLQQTIGEIAARIDRIEPRPAVRLALVSYRDRGDEYVARVHADFTGDVGAFGEALWEVSANGGGDTPEDLTEGLRMGLEELQWNDDAVRLTFLVADAAPQLGYNQQFSYLDGARQAVAQGIKIYPIAASNTDPTAEYVFRQLAQQTLGRFIFLTYDQGMNGGAPGDTTTMNVDPQAFSVERLDDLVVQVVEREIAAAAGAR